MHKKLAVLSGKTLLSLVLLFGGVVVSNILLQFIPGGKAVTALATPAGLVLSAWLMFVWFEKKKGWTVGWKDTKGAGHFLTGGMIATIIVGLSATLLFSSGTVEIDQNSWSWGVIILQVLLFLSVAVGEEWLFRGYLYGLYGNALGIRSAVVINSMLFTVIHLINPGGISRPFEHIVLEMINIFLSAILMSQARVFTRTLWMPIGLHFMLNFVQSTVFGFVNGGKEVDSLFHLSYERLTLWNGASYGLESGLIYTLVLLAAITVYGLINWRKYQEW